MSLRFALPVLLALVIGCGPDAAPRDCHAGPDFQVTVRAAPGLPIPADTVLRLHYGARSYDNPETLVLSMPDSPKALFCYVANRKGVYPEDAPAFGSGVSSSTGGSGGGSGAGGAGGDSGDPNTPIEALLCKLWTDGSAELEVESSVGDAKLKLQPKRETCTQETVLDLAPGDGGA